MNKEYNLNKIVFLDRDGIINQLRKDYVKNLSELEILPNIGKNLSKLTKAGYKIIIVTNQSAVNRGLLSIKDLNLIHEFLIKKLVKDGCMINKIYFCPHLPEEGCDCRKPKTGLLKQALKDFSPVDISACWLIGDNETDIQAGKTFHIKTFKLNSNLSIVPAVNQILANTNKNSLKLNDSTI